MRVLNLKFYILYYMVITIIGIGLIGGSLAITLK